MGVVRDGEVHHEDAAVAAAHAEQSAGDHGHEDADESGEHRHDQGHEHGTAGDHCTHTHGAAVLPSSAPPAVFETVEQHFTDSAPLRALVSEPFTHPPRA